MFRPGWLRGDGVTIAACLIMMAVIFFLDLALPIGIVGSMLYILPVTFASRVKKLRHLYLIALIATVLTFAAVAPKTPQEVFLVAFNRPICAGIIWLVAFMGAQRRKGEMAREELVERLEHTTDELGHMNEDLQQFAYVASHDLREPLRMVSDYIALLEKRYSDKLDDRGKVYMRFAMDGAVRMDTLIVDLLTYSRAGTAPIVLQRVDLMDVMEKVRTNLGAAIEESNARIEIGPLPTVAADMTQMIQLFQNLISNSLKYRGENDPIVRVSAVERSNEWEVAVRDNGIGIPPDQQKRLFQMFSRLHTRTEYEGTGIGLALAKRIVERHGGRIWVESDGVHGSTFRFTISKNLGPVEDEGAREEKSSPQ